jgi:hypothetical protein
MIRIFHLHLLVYYNILYYIFGTCSNIFMYLNIPRMTQYSASYVVMSNNKRSSKCITYTLLLFPVGVILFVLASHYISFINSDSNENTASEAFVLSVVCFSLYLYTVCVISLCIAMIMRACRFKTTEMLLRATRTPSEMDRFSD